MCDCSNIVLPIGPTGPQGPQGAKGDTGDTGPAGANGTNGTNCKYILEVTPDYDDGYSIEINKSSLGSCSGSTSSYIIQVYYKKAPSTTYIQMEKYIGAFTPYIISVQDDVANSKFKINLDTPVAGTFTFKIVILAL